MRTPGHGRLGQEEGGVIEQCWPGGQNPGRQTGTQNASPVGLNTWHSASGSGQLNLTHGSSVETTDPSGVLSTTERIILLVCPHRKHHSNDRLRDQQGVQ